FPIIVGLSDPNVAFINKRDYLGLSDEQVRGLVHDLGDAKGAPVFVSRDRGKTFTRLGKPKLPPGGTASEPMVVERRDGSLWKLERTREGSGPRESREGGNTRAALQPSGIQS